MDGHLKSIASFASRLTSSDKSNLPKKKKEKLLNALKSGDLETIENILGDDAEGEVNKIRFGVIGGQSALHKAAHNGFTKIVDVLVNRYGADPRATNDTGKTPLHSAANRGHVSIARILIKNANADVNAVDNFGCTPLWYGMKHKEMLLFLLEQPGINIDQRNSEGRTTLHETVQMNDVGVAQTLLHHGGADLNKKDAQGNTPLHCAIASKANDLVKLFLESKHQDPNIRNKNGKTPSHFAVSEANIDALNLLIKSKVEIDVADNKSRTPLMEAVALGRVRLTKLLVGEAYANPHVKDEDGNTLLHLSIPKPPLLQYLLEEGNIDPELQNKHGETLFQVVEKKEELQPENAQACKAILNPTNLCRLYREKNAREAERVKELLHKNQQLTSRCEFLEKQLKAYGPLPHHEEAGPVE